MTLKDFAQDAFIRFDFIDIVERTPAGGVVRSFSLRDNLEYFDRFADNTSEPLKNEQFDFAASLGFGGRNPYAYGRVQLSFTLFGERTEVPYAGKNYTIEPSTLKWSIEILFWNLVSQSNYLELNLNLSTADGASIIGVRQNNTDAQTLQVVLSTSTLSQVFVELPLKVEIDTPENYTNFYKDPVVTNSKMQLFFPYFTQRLRYDPNIGLLLGGGSADGDGGSVVDDGSDGSDGDGDGSSSNSGLIVGLTVGLFTGAAVVVLITAGIVAVIGAWFKFNLGQRFFGRSTSSVIFEE